MIDHDYVFLVCFLPTILCVKFVLKDLPIVVVSNETSKGAVVARGYEGNDRVGIDGEEWHSDLSYMAEPPSASCLLMRKCPPPEAEDNITKFANMWVLE